MTSNFLPGGIIGVLSYLQVHPQGLFSNHAVVLCSSWHLLCWGFWPAVFENVLSLREVFVASCFPSFLFHPCEDKLNTLAISICLFCWSSAFCTCFLTPGVSSGPARPGCPSCSLRPHPSPQLQMMGWHPHLSNSLWDQLWAHWPGAPDAALHPLGSPGGSGWARESYYYLGGKSRRGPAHFS